MKIVIPKNWMNGMATGSLVLLLFAFITLGVGVASDLVLGVNITNNTVLAIVNITNTEPNITSVFVDDNDGTPADIIDLTPNGIRNVTCNATVFDYNGAGDLTGGTRNASLFIVGVDRTETDNNHYYTADHCGACETLTSTTARCPCYFNVQYYANDSADWICEFTVTDSGGTQVPSRQINLSDVENSSTVTVAGLLAINASSLINYGNLSVTETSEEIINNVTNVGNLPFNLSLRGYGGEDGSVVNNNVSMICDFGNISFGQQRFALGSENLGSTAFSTMFELTNQTNITSFNLPQRINDTNFGPDKNSTFWRLEVPLSVGGLCNGTIIFGAVEDTR